MIYKAEQNILRRLMDEIMSSESEGDPNDHKMEDKLLPTARFPCYVTQDGSKWRKHSKSKKGVRTRSMDKVSHLARLKGGIQYNNCASQIRECFITGSILEKIVCYTNFILSKGYDQTNQLMLLQSSYLWDFCTLRVYTKKISKL